MTGGNKMLQKLKNQKGVAVVEMLLLIVILIAVTLVFKEQLMDLVEDIFETIFKSAGKV